MRLEGKTALITGAASGIGRATARLFAREGAKVAVTDLDKDGAEAVVARIADEDGTARASVLDVRVEADWERAIGDVVDAWGALDVLVANAGVSHARPVAEMTLEEWRDVHAVNLDGAFLGTKHAVRAMREGAAGASWSSPRPRASRRARGRAPTAPARPPSGCSPGRSRSNARARASA